MRAFLIAFISFIVTTGLASADESCPPLTMMASLAMTLGPDGRPYIPVTINGTPETMLIDTGGVFTEITKATADQLQMSTHRSSLQFIGTNGDVSDRSARGSLTLGNLTASQTDFVVMTDLHGIEGAGLFAPNFLHAYDADFDFGAGKFNLISQNHCDGKVIYWPAQAVAVIPIRLDDVGHILLTVTLDGENFQAALDTGASQTVGDLSGVAERFHLNPGSADTPAAGRTGKNGATPFYSHRFKLLSLEGIAVSNPEVALIPDLMRRSTMERAANLEGGTRIPDRSSELALPEITLGMDILRKFHLYIAYKERKLYITPATGPAPSATVNATAGTKTP